MGTNDLAELSTLGISRIRLSAKSHLSSPADESVQCLYTIESNVFVRVSPVRKSIRLAQSDIDRDQIGAETVT